MNKDTREMLLSKINNDLETYAHTIEVTTNVMLESTLNNSISTRTKVIQSTGEIEHNSIINLNKHTNKKITKYSEYKTELNQLMLDNDIRNFKYKRFDLAINFYAEESFVNYYKLNNYLLNLISCKYKVRNNFATADILVNDNHSIAVKNDMFQVEYYDKFKESNGTDAVKTRLEFRKLRMNTKNSLTSEPIALCDYWCKLLDSLPEEQNKLIEEVNNKLVEKYFKYETHEKQWKNIDTFINCHTFSIFSSVQLADLYTKFGVPEQRVNNKVKNYKRKHKIEFFSLKELNLYIDFLKKQIETYYKM